jgi:hypothetical protein
VSFLALVAQPTTRREYRSSITARNSHPSRVVTHVTSVTHPSLGAVTSKSRSTTLGAMGSAWAESVVAR